MCWLLRRLPVNFQSVMDRPDLVRRVTPPSTTILNTQALQPPSHQASCRRAESDRPRDRARLGLLLLVAAWGTGQHGIMTWTCQQVGGSCLRCKHMAASYSAM
jgi:hypothetical protein